jgi:flavin-dependent dehydrogenase
MNGTKNGAPWDVVVVGARAAGSSAAMLMARQGMRVLVVDRAAVGTDTLSTHQIQLPGVARLARWGLLDRLVAAGNPAVRKVRFEQDSYVLEGCFPDHDGVDAVHGPRRTLLDPMLVDAARAAGAEVRDHETVEALLRDDDARVTGVRVAGRSGAVREERAALVVGADGKDSFVARTVDAPVYREQPTLTTGFYTYWSGCASDGGQIFAGPTAMVGAWPTDDGLTMTYVAWPAADFGSVRRDPEAAMLTALDAAGDLGERVRGGRREAAVRGTPDLPNRFRRPYGPGWALVGDAGLVMDPITAYGIGHAFRDAELVAQAACEGAGDPVRTETAMAGYQRDRDADAVPAYELTLDVASFAPLRPEQRVLLGRLAGDPVETSRFLGVLTGAISTTEYFSGRNLFHVLGVRGMARVVGAKAFARSA